MSGNRLPQETIDYILDLLREEPKTLKQCCLISRSWIPRVRKHLFCSINLKSPSDLEAWKKAFPEPTSSPGCFTRSLRIGHAELVAAVSNGRSLIHAFSHVVRLQLSTRHLPLLALQVAKIICSLPVLEDLEAFCVEKWNDDEDGVIFQPQTSPPMTGMLHLRLVNGIESIARRLLDLPNGIRFRKFACAWHRLEDLQWITALVEGCAESLERVDIVCDTYLGARVASIDLSKAIRLREVVLRLDIGDAWAGPTLKTLTSGHKDLQLISIYPRFDASGIRRENHTLWVDLDHALVQLWESKALTIRVAYDTDGEETEARKFLEQLLPEVTRRGIVELVDCGMERWLVMASKHGL